MPRQTLIARIRQLSFLLLVGITVEGAAQTRVPGTVVIGVVGDPSLPIPYVSGIQNTQNADVGDQLFLRFGIMKPGFRTVGDDALSPMLARSWKRVDSLTLLFELDPRAHWHDGAPVTAHDAVFTWSIAHNPKINANQAAIETIAAVEEAGPRTVRVRFRRAFPEQLYRFAFDFQPLPSHLLEKMAPDAIVTSDYAAHPVGNGPYRWSRRVPGQLVELRADSTFFAGRPGIARVMFLVVPDAAARLNRLMSGDLDVMDNVQAVNLAQVSALPSFRIEHLTGNTISYALFNSRNATDSGTPNRFFTDVRVREALTLALDRRTMATLVYGTGTAVPDAAQSLLWSWITGGTISSAPANVPKARALLAAAGWRDTDGDGILDKGGARFTVSVIYPDTPTRSKLAIQSQAMWKAIGVNAELHPFPGPQWQEHHLKGDFDIDFAGANQDATPLSLVESWSCAAAARATTSNAGRWCDPEFDRLLNKAVTGRGAVADWRAVLARMTSQHPAAFLASPPITAAIHTRYENATILPSRQWLALWQWRIRSGAAIARDR